VKENVVRTAQLLLPRGADFAEAGPIVKLVLVEGLEKTLVDVGLQLLSPSLIDGQVFGAEPASLLEFAAASMGFFALQCRPLQV